MSSLEVLICCLASFLFSSVNTEVIIIQLHGLLWVRLLPPGGLERHDSTHSSVFTSKVLHLSRSSDQQRGERYLMGDTDDSDEQQQTQRQDDQSDQTDVRNCWT